MTDGLTRNRAVFLDKDGTLVEDVPYNVDPEKLRFKEGTVESLKLLQQAGYRLIVVSNQSGVAKGYFTIDAVQSLAAVMQEQLNAEGVMLSDFYFCPHHPGGTVEAYAVGCDCRKPAAGLFLKAATDWNLSLNRCWMIGDILDDIEAGHRAGCRSILLNNGGEDQWLPGINRTPDWITETITSAVQFILSND